MTQTCTVTHLDGGVMSPFVSPSFAIARVHDPTVTSKISWADRYVAKPGDLSVCYIDSFMPGLTQVQCSVSMSLALEYACQLWDPYPTQGYTVTGIDTEICL